MDKSLKKVGEKLVRGLLGYFTISIFILAYGCAKPPVREMRNAQMAIDNARRAEADVYAPVEFKSAEDYLDQASRRVEEKSYDNARELAIKSKNKANEARNKATQVKIRVKTEAKQKIEELKTAIEAAEVAGAEKYSYAALSTVKKILREAENDYNIEKYYSAKEKAESGIAQAYNLEASSKAAQEAALAAERRMREVQMAETERLHTLREEEKRREEERKLRASKIRRHIVERGECLWLISQDMDIYADPYQWPIIYRANRSQINDPDLIYPGQNFVIPRNIPARDIDNSIRYARYRGLWSLFDGK